MPCQLFLFAAISVLTSYRVSLPNKSLMFDALDYSEFTYKTSRPWDNETMDAMHKGEFLTIALLRTEVSETVTTTDIYCRNIRVSEKKKATKSYIK